MRCVSRSLRHIWLWENLQTYFLSDDISQMAWQQVGLATFWLWIRTLPFYSLVLEICVEIYLAALYMLWKTTKYLTSFHNVIFQPWKVLQFKCGLEKKKEYDKKQFFCEKSIYLSREIVFDCRKHLKIGKKESFKQSCYLKFKLERVWNLTLSLCLSS